MAKFSTPTDVFESGCDLVDVSSMHRPDTDWRVTDAHGHEHRWYADGEPATSYTASGRYDVPSIVWVHERWGYYEDGDRYSIGHNGCRDCGDHVEPRYTADVTTQYMPGLRWYRINGQSVSQEEFQRRYSERH